MGTAAVQIARALGAIVVGTAGTKDGMDVVTRFSSITLFPAFYFFSSDAEHIMCSITTTSLMRRKW